MWSSKPSWCGVPCLQEDTHTKEPFALPEKSLSGRRCLPTNVRVCVCVCHSITNSIDQSVVIPTPHCG